MRFKQIKKILICWLAILASITLPISFQANVNGESLDDILPGSMVIFKTPNGDVAMGNTELQSMSLHELKNFNIMISICTKVHSSPETVAIIGKKLLPRFFN